MISYSTNQKKNLKIVRNIVVDWFTKCPVPAHSFRHAQRTAIFARTIARSEKGANIFLCELAGYLHDIGRVPEFLGEKPGIRHHELSYDLLRVWFKEKSFDFLTVAEKKEILYAVRYHWNDEADGFQTAWILRDADKLDMFGHEGVRRSFSLTDKNNMEKFMVGLRLRYHALANLRTKSAKKIMTTKKLFDPIENHMRKMLKKAIVPVEL